jgi:hypothetical protein
VTGISERIEQVRCMEICNYATYDQEMIVFGVMGLGRSMDEVPMLLQPGILTMAWGGVVHQLAAGLGVQLDAVEEEYERVPAPRRSTSRTAGSSRAPSPGCASRCAACAAGGRCACSST